MCLGTYSVIIFPTLSTIRVEKVILVSICIDFLTHRLKNHCAGNFQLEIFHSSQLSKIETFGILKVLECVWH